MQLTRSSVEYKKMLTRFESLVSVSTEHPVPTSLNHNAHTQLDKAEFRMKCWFTVKLKNLKLGPL